jgi:hypothetical protein
MADRQGRRIVDPGRICRQGGRAVDGLLRPRAAAPSTPFHATDPRIGAVVSIRADLSRWGSLGSSRPSASARQRNPSPGIERGRRRLRRRVATGRRLPRGKRVAKTPQPSTSRSDGAFDPRRGIGGRRDDDREAGRNDDPTQVRSSRSCRLERYESCRGRALGIELTESLVHFGLERDMLLGTGERQPSRRRLGLGDASPSDTLHPRQVLAERLNGSPLRRV